MKLIILMLLFAPATSLAQSQSAVDIEKERAALLRVHRTDRQAHLKTDVELLLKTSPEQFISVASGKIFRSNKTDERKHFEQYFRGAKYYEWDDVEEPIIRVSRDATMAWMITRVRVRRVQKGAGSEEREQGFIYAGIMTYEKRDGEWIRVANVSTFEPIKPASSTM